MNTRTRLCPGCDTRLVRPGMLACAACWRQVSRPVQQAVYATFLPDGAGIFSGDYREARAAAIEEMRNARLDKLQE